MGTPLALSKSTLCTPKVIAAFSTTQTQLLALLATRLGWIIRNPIGNTQILYLRFAAIAPTAPITDATAHWALAPVDLVDDSVIGYCGLIFGSFSGPVAEVPVVVEFT